MPSRPPAAVGDRCNVFRLGIGDATGDPDIGRAPPGPGCLSVECVTDRQKGPSESGADTKKLRFCSRTSGAEAAVGEVPGDPRRETHRKSLFRPTFAAFCSKAQDCAVRGVQGGTAYVKSFVDAVRPVCSKGAAKLI